MFNFSSPDRFIGSPLSCGSRVGSEEALEDVLNDLVEIGAELEEDGEGDDFDEFGSHAKPVKANRAALRNRDVAARMDLIEGLFNGNVEISEVTYHALIELAAEIQSGAGWPVYTATGMTAGDNDAAKSRAAATVETGL